MHSSKPRVPWPSGSQGALTVPVPCPLPRPSSGRRFGSEGCVRVPPPAARAPTQLAAHTPRPRVCVRHVLRTEIEGSTPAPHRRRDPRTPGPGKGADPLSPTQARRGMLRDITCHTRDAQGGSGGGRRVPASSAYPCNPGPRSPGGLRTTGRRATSLTHFIRWLWEDPECSVPKRSRQGWVLEHPGAPAARPLCPRLRPLLPPASPLSFRLPRPRADGPCPGMTTAEGGRWWIENEDTRVKERDTRVNPNTTITWLGGGGALGCTPPRRLAAIPSWELRPPTTPPPSHVPRAASCPRPGARGALGMGHLPARPHVLCGDRGRRRRCGAPPTMGPRQLKVVTCRFCTSPQNVVPLFAFTADFRTSWTQA